MWYATNILQLWVFTILDTIVYRYVAFIVRLPVTFDHLFGIWNVSYGSQLVDMTMRFHLRSTRVLAALPHLWKVVDLCYSVQCLLLGLCLHFQVVISNCRIQCRVMYSQHPVIGWRKLPYYDFSAKGFTCGFWLLPAYHILRNGKPGLQYNTIWYDGEYVACHIGEIGIIWVCFLVLTPLVNDIRDRECTANHHRVGMVLIMIRINVSPVLWLIRQWIQIKSCGCD